MKIINTIDIIFDNSNSEDVEKSINFITEKIKDGYIKHPKINNKDNKTIIILTKIM